jgi:hypothetical protein
MRRIAPVVAVVISGLAIWAVVVYAHRQEAEPQFTIYDPNPAHIWNRLHAVLFIRDDLPLTRQFPDPLDPPYWPYTRYLLERNSHRRVLQILDEFLRTHAENLIHDPIKRALLQRDLLAVFDWSVKTLPIENKDRRYEKEKQELQARLAEVMRRVALTPEEIRSVPRNYDPAVASGQFAAEFDPAQRERAFLPPDLFDPRGPWVELEGPGAPEPVAEQHVAGFSGRSSFSIFMRLPQGRKAAFDYLATLWNFPEPTIPSPKYAPNLDVAPNPHLPQFPAGTEFALVRQMNLIDTRGQFVLTPLTESVQIRVYRSIHNDEAPPPLPIDEFLAHSRQDFYEFTLSRERLFANVAGGLRATGREEKQLFAFNTPGPDVVPSHPMTLDRTLPVLKQCILCHREEGIHSVQSRMRLLPPHPLQRDEPHDTGARDWWQDPRTIAWKQRQDAWTLLSRYWQAPSAHR